MFQRLRAVLQPAHVREFDPWTPEAPTSGWLALEPRILLDGALDDTSGAFDADRSPVVDLNGPSAPGVDHAVLYPDREVSTAIGAADAFVEDAQDDIARIEIVVTGDLVEGMDAVRIGDRIVNLSRGGTFEDVAVGGGLFDMTFDAETRTIALVDADGGPIADADATALLRTLEYGNLDLEARRGVLNFAFVMTDEEGFTNARASVDLTIESDGANPYALLDPDGSDSPDGLFVATFREADGLGIAVADDDIAIVNRGGEPIRQVLITLSNPQEGDALRIQVPSDIEGITANVRTIDDGSIRVRILTSSQAAGENYEDLARVISSVRFVNDSEDPSDITRLISVRLQEGDIFGTPTRMRMEVVPENDAPTLDLDEEEVTEYGPDFATTWVEGQGGAPLILRGGSDLEDVDDDVLSGATILNANAEDGDRLFVAEPLPTGIDAQVSDDGARITLAGEASLPAYVRALEALRFAADDEDPTEGVRTIRITVSDGERTSNTATALVTVEAENDAPTVVAGPLDDLQRGLDGRAIDPVDASQSFEDVDDTELRYAIVGAAPDWLAIDAGTGLITGTPPADASQIRDPQTGREGRYEVRVRATDPDNAFAETTVVFQVANPAPVAVDDTGQANDGGPRIAGNVLTGDAGGGNADADPDGDALAVAFVEDSQGNVGRSVPGSTGGSFVVLANGDYTFDPGTDFLFLVPGETRTTAITYRVSDGEGGFDTASLAVTVVGRNNAPVARDDAVAAFADRPVSGNVMIDNGNGADTDPDGDRLEVALVDGATFTPGERMALPSGAFLTVRLDGSYTYDPGRAFESRGVGQTDTDTFTYTVRDPFGVRSTATVTVAVRGTNDAPIPLDPSRPSIDPSRPGAPPTDPDDPRAPPLDPQDYIPLQPHVDGETIEPFALAPWFGDPDSGDVLTHSVDETLLPPGLAFDAASGAITGTLAPDASQGGRGGVYVVPVTATDGEGASFTTNLTIAVANPEPIAFDDGFATVATDVVIGNVLADNGSGPDTDPDGDALFVTSPDRPAPGSAGGTFTIGPDGAMTFDPGDDFVDLARGETRDTRIEYAISDGQGGEARATVAVTVTGGNGGPRVGEAAEDRDGLDAAPIAVFDASQHFFDPDGDTLTYALGVGAPDWMRIDAATGTITGTPPNDASAGGNNGLYRVEIVASDGTESARLPVTWRIDNPAPTGVDDAWRLAGDTPAALDLLANDTDPDGDVLRVIAVDGRPIAVGETITLASGATLTMRGPNDCVWQPSAGMIAMEVGERFRETFTYTLVDAQGARSQATAETLVVGTVPSPQPPSPPEPPSPPQPPVDGPVRIVPGEPALPRPVPVVPDIETLTGDPILATALEGIVPLAARIDLELGSPEPVLTQALAQIAPLGNHVTLFGSPSLGEALAGIDADSRWEALVGSAFEGHELTVDGVTFRTIVAGDVVHLDLGSFGGAGYERWRVTGDGAARLHLLDRNIVQIDRPADRDHVHLDVTARAPDGRLWRLPLGVDTVHGEIVREGPLAPIETGRRTGFTEQVRAALAPVALPVVEDGRVVDLSEPPGAMLCVPNASGGGADGG